MKLKMKRFIFCLVILIPGLLHAQTQLTLQTAIDSALKNNLDIQIAKNYVQIAKVSNTYGMAGGLPYINGNASDNFMSDALDQKLNGSPETYTPGVLGNSVNASINANIVLFNGWIKDKNGKSEREDREIEKAIDLYKEFLAEYPGGNI